MRSTEPGKRIFTPLEHDPTTYANAVATGYYPDIKASSPNVLVGVVVNPGNSPAWDPIVLADAKYDFVEYHYYPETPGSENDTTLIKQDAQALTTNINTIKSELATAGHSGTPIYVGEIGATYSNPGKQSWSITQGLYAGQVLGEMMNDGVTRLTWWIGFGNCNGQAGNDSSSVYGWQNFGAYNVFSDGPSDPTCPSGSTAPDWGPIGTMSPTGRAFQLFSQVAVNGEHVLTPTVTGDTTDVVAYAATHSGGTALVLFNRNETTSETVQVTLTGVSSAIGSYRNDLQQGALRSDGRNDSCLGCAHHHQPRHADPAADADPDPVEHERGHHSLRAAAHLYLDEPSQPKCPMPHKVWGISVILI